MKKLVGVFAAAALLGSGVALAQDDISKDTQQQQQPGSAQGGSGAAGSGSMQGSSGSMDQGSSAGGSGQQAMAGEKELTGKVVKSTSKMVWVDHMGAIVPLKVERTTVFADPSLKGAKNLKEGQEIRASYEVKETDNVAKSITPSTGTGGSGSDVMAPDSSINQDTGGSGMEKDKDLGGTGGAGMEQGQDVGGSPQDSSMNPDTSSSPDTGR